MPWYYAGPEAKPVGPVSLEELHARRVKGTILPETYVIEDTGRPDAPPVWKRYQEVFPATPSLPPIPIAAPVTPPPYHPAPPPVAQPHPLFPSAAPQPGHNPVFKTPAGPDPYYSSRKTNSWCAWGFGLGIASFFLSFACGLGFLLGMPALLICLVGLVQTYHHPEQSGRAMAISGLVLSLLAIVISIALLAWAIPQIKAHELTTTEQTSNDSQ